MSMDTLTLTKRLAALGFKEEQAEGLASTIKEAVSEGDVVTKPDLREALVDLELRLTVRMGAMFVATITILGFLMNFFLS